MNATCNIYIEPTTEYLAVDYRREHYYGLSQQEITHHCTTVEDEHYCKVKHPIFNLNAKEHECEISLLKHKNAPIACNFKYSYSTTFWIQLTQPNKWLYTTAEQCVLEEICKDTITQHTIHDAGIIDLQIGCYIQSPNFIIHSHKVKVSRSYNYFLPSTNISVIIDTIKRSTNVSNPTKPVLIRLLDKNSLADISHSIDELKSQEAADDTQIDLHHTHHYISTYAIAIILISVAVYGPYCDFRLDIRLRFVSLFDCIYIWYCVTQSNVIKSIAIRTLKFMIILMIIVNYCELL